MLLKMLKVPLRGHNSRLYLSLPSIPPMIWGWGYNIRINMSPTPRLILGVKYIRLHLSPTPRSIPFSLMVTCPSDHSIYWVCGFQ